jgi:4-hydroxythreonine-4-phosphate dehydrogenase
MAKKNLLPLLVTIGDPNGIGPEIAVSLWKMKHSVKRPIALVGDFQVVLSALALKGISKEAVLIESPEEAKKACELGMIPVLSCGVNFKGKIRPGKICKEAGKASIAWVREATKLCLEKRAAAVVTAPLCKESVEKTVPSFQGHTEFIGEMCGDSRPVLCLVHKDWVVAHVSTHVSLREACDRAKKERILKTATLLNDFLIRYKKVKTPCLGIAGLNPHAGEGGLFGTEEIEEIIPAVRELKKKKIKAEGPFPGDVIFPKLRSGAFDGVVAMYHDQGHIVTKTLLFQLGQVKKTGGVNTTLGLPVIRTSVDHGTGFDIAWQGIADANSLKDALELAECLALD